jgi:hypothetical protein
MELELPHTNSEVSPAAFWKKTTRSWKITTTSRRWGTSNTNSRLENSWTELLNTKVKVKTLKSHAAETEHKDNLQNTR